ncbi:hypothetical protein [Kordia sp.]|uniref:hypothetical protein n=1 Tax=Kordia sp. TaxID=1965332 RepID=UPI003D6B8443
MKTLKLKKVKISSITNPYLLYGGAEQAASNNDKTVPNTIHCETQDEADYTCTTQTNGGGTVGRTGAASRNRQANQN